MPSVPAETPSLEKYANPKETDMGFNQAQARIERARKMAEDLRKPEGNPDRQQTEQMIRSIESRALINAATGSYRERSIRALGFKPQEFTFVHQSPDTGQSVTETVIYFEKVGGDGKPMYLSENGASVPMNSNPSEQVTPVFINAELFKARLVSNKYSQFVGFDVFTIPELSGSGAISGIATVALDKPSKLQASRPENNPQGIKSGECSQGHLPNADQKAAQPAAEAGKDQELLDAQYKEAVNLAQTFLSAAGSRFHSGNPFPIHGGGFDRKDINLIYANKNTPVTLEDIAEIKRATLALTLEGAVEVNAVTAQPTYIGPEDKVSLFTLFSAYQQQTGNVYELAQSNPALIVAEVKKVMAKRLGVKPEEVQGTDEQHVSWAIGQFNQFGDRLYNAVSAFNHNHS